MAMLLVNTSQKMCAIENLTVHIDNLLNLCTAHVRECQTHVEFVVRELVKMRDEILFFSYSLGLSVLYICHPAFAMTPFVHPLSVISCKHLLRNDGCTHSDVWHSACFTTPTRAEPIKRLFDPL